MNSGHCECLTHPQVSAGQGGEEEVAGLLQRLGGDERQQHKGIAHQRQQDDQPEYAPCRHYVIKVIKLINKENILLQYLHKLKIILKG